MKQLELSRDDDGTWVVTCEKVPGLVIKGNSQVEAIEKMKKALSMYFPCGDCKGTS
jgi:predicted RNase H-like HicB family nuclease